MATPQPNRSERGVALITTSMVLVPLMIFAAFGVDLASWYSRLTDLQRAADAAALAGAVWMPDLARATDEAEDSLASNGIVHGVDSMVVDIERGATPTSLRVTVTDTDAERYFSQIVASGPQSLTRFAEAEYNLPIPLGSPLNYFAGDATSGQYVWPPDAATRHPDNLACNVTGANQAWDNQNPPAFYPNASYGSPPNGQCAWSVRPADYRSVAPTNAPCNATGRNTSFNGHWPASGAYVPGSRFTGDPGNRQCIWAATVTPPAASALPSNRPCMISGQAAAGWFATGSATTITTGSLPAETATGHRLCRWTRVRETLAGSIDPTRSPGFWALIEGPGTAATQGDAYTPRCYITANCSSVENASHRSSDDTRGYWYVVKIPPGLTGDVRIDVYDASNNPGGSQTDVAGDSSINASNQSFQTEYRVFEQTNPLEFTNRVPISTGSADTNFGSCYWQLGSEPQFRGQWRELCTLNGVSPGEIYLINVRTNGTTGSGINGYGLQACANGSCTSGAQPALYAFSDMAMYNNIAGGDATFYLAEVGPQYAGRVLVIELWDAGDASGNATLYPMRPSASAVRPVMNVPEDDCTYTSSPAPNVAQSTSVGGPTGFVYSTPRPSDDPDGSGVCAIRTTISGARQFNGEWLRIRVNIPVDYTCTPGVNPETTVNSCWWGIRYSLSAQATDVTTWQARIEGNPLQLTE